MNIKKDICDVLKEAYNRGWITTRDGNAAVKVGETVYITPSGVKKYALKPSDIISIETDRKPKSTPSGELEMHLYLLCLTGVKASLHLHPTHIVALMASTNNPNVFGALANQYPELSRYTVVGSMVPALPPVSSRLANATLKAIRFNKLTDCEIATRADIVGQKNHGATAVGKTLWEAFEHIERLEHVCKIELLSRR